MAERFTPHHNHHEHNVPTHEKAAETSREAVARHHEKAETHHQSERNELYKTIEQHAVSTDTHKAHSAETSHHERPHHYITQTVKRSVYSHTIANVQTHLKPRERAFSRVIHNDTIETISELGASSVARPSAILGGGVFMVLGGLALLVTARYFGFTIPLSSLLVLYGIGFALLFTIDIVSKPLRRRLKKRP